MAGIAAVVTQDVPPFLTIAGNPTAPFGINSEGLKRRGFTPEAIAALKRAYRTLYKSGLSLAEARAQLESQAAEEPGVQPLVEFLAQSTRGILR
jgi:UDP-N-acetylglucosamine acyltransferase